MPPSHPQHGQQAAGDGAGGRGFTSTARRSSTGALHTPGGFFNVNFKKRFHFVILETEFSKLVAL